MNSLQICSLNARGLRDQKKRNDLFFWTKQKKFDVIFLQETYWTENLEYRIKKEWKGESILSFGSEHSKGNAILFKDNLPIEITNMHKSADSRIILINIKTDNEIITLVNVYAPNIISERKAFFNKVQKWVDQYALNKQQLIIGGDLNHTELNHLDRRTLDSQVPKDASTVSYKTLLSIHDLHDVWREMHPNRKQFTFKDISRLDKFLVSTELMNYTQKTDIISAGIKTDHKCILILLNLNKTNKGPGWWKLNTSILLDKLYQEKIKEILEKTKQKYSSLSKQLLWEISKIKIKEFSISYCKNKQKVKRDLIKDLELKIEQKENELIQSNYNHTIQVSRDALINDLHFMIQQQNVGAQIRSRAKWIEEGEKSTKYFFNLEKQRNSSNTIKQLKKEDGTNTFSQTEILNEEYNYYKKLYTNKETNQTDNDILRYIENTNIQVLNENDKNLLEGEITEIECENVIGTLKINKSPGCDGISAEFYKAFWPNIKTLLLDSLNEAYHTGELSPTQKRSVLSLIYKKNDKTLLTNWRPISLLNTDYKILAHVLANRLKKVIAKLIKTDQNGYIKGRNISYNIRLIQDVIDHLESDNIEGAIVFLDFQKAFDTVDHKFLQQTLKQFNFGDSFLEWVKALYNNAESCVSNNGWVSEPFKIKRGIRQGCPLSALLFLLVVEILAEKIRSNKENAIEIKSKSKSKFIHLAQLADDTTLFLKDETAVINCLKIVENFGEFSGLKLNKDKTEGLWLGQAKNRSDTLAGINWGKQHVKALGVFFGYNKKEIEKLNWDTKIESIKKNTKFLEI